MGIWLYNSEPINIKKLEQYKPHKRKLKFFLLDNVFYSAQEFLCYWFEDTAACTESVNNNI
jgi:hypothetical protein